jgi:hypothetical protein
MGRSCPPSQVSASRFGISEAGRWQVGLRRAPAPSQSAAASWIFTSARASALTRTSGTNSKSRRVMWRMAAFEPHVGKLRAHLAGGRGDGVRPVLEYLASKPAGRRPSYGSLLKARAVTVLTQSALPARYWSRSFGSDPCSMDRCVFSSPYS